MVYLYQYYNLVKLYSVQWQGFLLIYWPWFSLHKMVYLSILYSVQWQEKRTTIKLSNQGLYIPKNDTSFRGSKMGYPKIYICWSAFGVSNLETYP